MELRANWSRIHTRMLLTVILVMVAVGIAAAENVDPTNDGSQYAWGENVGWLNAEPGGDGGPGVQVDDRLIWIFTSSDLGQRPHLFLIRIETLHRGNGKKFRV